MTSHYRMNLNMIWLGNWFQSTPNMPKLTTTLLSTLVSQSMFAYFLQPNALRPSRVTRRWLTTVMAVFIQPVFKRLYPGFHCPAIRHHLIKQSYHYTFSFSIGSLYFGLRWQMEFAHLLNLNWRLYDLH
jgi:hypothetical protein